MVGPARAASDCGFNLDYAELIAIGAAHREALYLVTFTSESSANRRVFPIVFHLTGGTDAGVTTAFDAEQVTAAAGKSWDSAAFLVVFPSPGIRWFTLDSVAVGTTSTICAEDDRYVLPEALCSTDGTFDDAASAPGPLPIAMVFEPPAFIYKIAPHYPDDAKDQHLQGDVTVAVTIDATGKTTDAMVVTGSGYRYLDDAALAAARGSGFGPFIMPVALGIKPAAIRFVIIYSFRLDE